MQVFDTSPKVNVNHNTETNSSERGDVWFACPCSILLLVTQINFWLVAKSNLERKRIQSSTQKYRTPSKTPKLNKTNLL